MTDIELRGLVDAAFDDAGAIDSIRHRLRDAVAVVRGAGAARAGLHAADGAADARERRATAFRAMAGVRR